MKNYLLINTYNHVDILTDSAIIYNPLNHRAIEIYDSEVLDLLRRIIVIENLFVIGIKLEQLNSKKIKEFIEHIQNLHMGELIINKSKKKPVQILPYLDIDEDIKKLDYEGEYYLGENILENILEIFLYVNSSLLINKDELQNAYKQFPYCYYGREYEELDISIVTKIIKEVEYTRDLKLNIIGGNILNYSYFEKLVRLLNKNAHHKNYFFNIEYNNLAKVLTKFDLGKTQLTFLSTPLDDASKFQAILHDIKTKSEFIFPIQTTRDIRKLGALTKNLVDFDYTIFPYYNGSNYRFFEENVFYNKEDVLLSYSDILDISINKRINSNLYGSLYVMPDCYVYSNLNLKPIGNIRTNTLKEIVFYELSQTNSWKLTRDKVDPCKNCLFQQLCPPISNYELFFEKYNLCNIK